LSELRVGTNAIGDLSAQEGAELSKVVAGFSQTIATLTSA
jgi:hypothetical protein